MRAKRMRNELDAPKKHESNASAGATAAAAK